MTEQKYHLAARVIHWIMALGFVFMWACGYSMTNLVEEDSAFESLLFSLHISVGVTLFFVLLSRVAIRLLFKPPPLPAAIPKLDRVGAHLGHAALYALPFMIILIGWAEVDFGGHGVQWFGVDVPKIFPTRETLAGVDLEETTETIHMWLAYTMLVVALVHVAAVIKHRWLDGHDILVRMTLAKPKAPVATTESSS